MFLTFLSDFGFEDAFLGVCKGVIARTAPQVRVLDVLHLIARQDVEQGAVVLAGALPYLPAPAVHLALVDPFRSTPVRPVAVRTADGSVFVAPDNGLTSQAWTVAGGAVSAHVLDDESLWLTTTARTFRARDVYSPVAALLAAGLPVARVGTEVPVEDLARLDQRPPTVDDDHVHAEVVQVDHFGNLTLNIQRADLEAAGVGLGDRLELRCGGKTLSVPFCLTYGEVPRGRLAVCEDSFRTVTIAVNGGSAAATLRARRADPLVLARLQVEPAPAIGPVRVYEHAPSTVTA